MVGIGGLLTYFYKIYEFSQTFFRRHKVFRINGSMHAFALDYYKQEHTLQVICFTIAHAWAVGARL